MELQSGERIIYEGHPSWRSILGFYLKGFAVALAFAVIAGAITKATDDEVNNGLAVMLGLGVAALTIVIGFIKRVATTYTITNRRLNIKRGIVARKVQETRLQRVQNVNFNQSVYQRFVQIGDVDFDTAAGDDYNFVFAGVSEPAEVVERVDRATHAVGDEIGDEEPL